MIKITKTLKEKVRILSEVLARYSSRLQKPEGSLKICRKKSGSYYYCRNGDRLTYIKQKEIALARRLVQRELEWKSVPAIKHDIKILSEAIGIADSWPWERILSKMPKEKQELARLPVKTNAELEAEWLSRSRKKLEFRDGDRVYQSAAGAFYRSKSEAMYADLLE